MVKKGHTRNLRDSEGEGTYPLRIKIKDELLPLVLLVIVLTAAITLFPSNILRIILGLPFVLFFPGYTLMASLFPRRESVSGIERVALSFGMSIAVVPLIGLILNYTPWGIRLESVLWLIASFIFITAAIAWFKRRELPKDERFGVEFDLGLVSRGIGTRDKVLSIILMLIVLGALGIIGYTIAAPKTGQQFTEFYILGAEGKATAYPKELKVGQESRVTIGVVNNEHETMSYRLEVRVGGVKTNEIGSIILEHDEKWEEIVTFTLSKAGEEQKVEFLLYKNRGVQPFLEPLRLWVDVTE